MNGQTEKKDQKDKKDQEGEKDQVVPECVWQFPNPDQTDSQGLLAAGGDLEIGTLYHAYARGIFPWPQEGYPVFWFSPPKRGILSFSNLHLSQSFLKWRKKTNYEVTFNTSFREVMENCRDQKRPGQDGTWILSEMVEAYEKFHLAGFAHSIEIWMSGRLVGGLYGVCVEGVFSGESMFYHVPNASKAALYETCRLLEHNGYEWMDVQMLTQVTEQMGGRYIERSEFLDLLKSAKSKNSWNLNFKHSKV